MTKQPQRDMKGYKSIHIHAQNVDQKDVLWVHFSGAALNISTAFMNC